LAQNPHGILVREAIIRITPDESAPQLGSSTRGSEVAILETSRDWIKVLAPTGPERDVTGWILDKGVVRQNTTNGDKILFGEAADSEDQASRPHGRQGAARDAMRLYFRVYDFFPKSPLAGEALYRSADIRWQVDYADVMTLPSAKQMDPDARPKIDEDYMHEVMKKFPHTRWADLAAFHLIDNQLCGDWQGQSKCPERESEVYEKYARERPQSPKTGEALYDAASRQAALIEIYKTENDPKRSDQARSRALALSGQVSSQYPDSDWGPRAIRLAFFVQQNIPLYGNARQ
jgi:outer membrane protein assembly factor BamD (BamD/ComL family)